MSQKESRPTSPNDIHYDTFDKLGCWMPLVLFRPLLEPLIVLYSTLRKASNKKKDPEV